jgi:hypothetical protein
MVCMALRAWVKCKKYKKKVQTELEKEYCTTCIFTTIQRPFKANCMALRAWAKCTK